MGMSSPARRSSRWTALASGQRLVPRPHPSRGLREPQRRTPAHLVGCPALQGSLAGRQVPALRARAVCCVELLRPWDSVSVQLLGTKGGSEAGALGTVESAKPSACRGECAACCPHSRHLQPHGAPECFTKEGGQPSGPARRLGAPSAAFERSLWGAVPGSQETTPPERPGQPPPPGAWARSAAQEQGTLRPSRPCCPRSVPGRGVGGQPAGAAVSLRHPRDQLQKR